MEVQRNRSGNQWRTERGSAARQLPLNFLAIGDSWFDYPLTDDGFITPIDQSIIGEVGTQLQSMGSPPPTILSYALYGQSTTQVLSYERQEQILSALTDPNTTQWNNGITADGILVSMGGNDIAGDQFAIYIDYHGTGLDQDRFEGSLASIQASYMDLFDLRDVAAAKLAIDPKQIPIFGHCYDYAIPNNCPAGRPFPIAGPWLWPSLNFAGYDYNEGLTIVQKAIDCFRETLIDLASDKVTLAGKTTNNFVLVKTVGTLTRDSNRPNGWANELHPYTEGFNSLANEFYVELQSHFPGRI